MIQKIQKIIRNEKDRITEIHNYCCTDRDVAQQLLAAIHAEAQHYEVVKRVVAAVDGLSITVTVDPATLPASPGGATAVAHELAALLRQDGGWRQRCGWGSITIRLGPGESPEPRSVPVQGALESGAAHPPARAVGFRGDTGPRA